MKKTNAKYIILLTVLILATVTGTFYKNAYTLNKSRGEGEILSDVKQNLLIEIDTTNLNRKISNKESFYIYIGRTSCPDCKVFMPKLIKKLSSINKQLLYYNTEVPASKKQEMRKYLKILGVNSIPSVIFFSKGAVNQLYDCQDNNQFENFIKNFK